jgi:predicted nucleic acid-binding protein
MIRRKVIESPLSHVSASVGTERNERTIEADPAGNRVLEAAAAGNVAAVVSGDRHPLGLGAWRGIPIQTPAAFVAGGD